MKTNFEVPLLCPIVPNPRPILQKEEIRYSERNLHIVLEKAPVPHIACSAIEIL
jgi:hypothetical protein